MIEFNSNSPSHLSLLFFGGCIKYNEKVQELNELGIPIKYKSGLKKGEIKYKNKEVMLNIEGLGLKSKNKTKKSGIFTTNEKILKLISVKKSTDAGRIASIMLKIRSLEKMINTYYSAVANLIYYIDNCIHAELCHCGYELNNGDFGGGTQTGRLSSRNPNIQNQPRGAGSKVKEHFTSRWGNDGVIMEFDYSQLEVVACAFITKDLQLIEDLKNNIDIHKVLASTLLNKSMDCITSQERQLIKPCTFHVIYGGGVKRLAVEQNLSEEFCKNFINNFYKRYPEVKKWQDEAVMTVEKNSELIDERTKKGFLIKKGYFNSITGRRYEFKSSDAPDFLVDRGIMTAFNPPDIKNYPIQGFATADLVPIMIGRLWRKSLKHKDKYLLINTVHDSIVIDCKKEFKEYACNFIKNELQLVHEEMRRWFNLDFDIPIKVDVKVGNNWRECNL